MPNWFLLIVHNLATPHDAFDDKAGRQGRHRKTEVRSMKKNATFVKAKGRAEIGATRRGKGMKIMAIVDRH